MSASRLDGPIGEIDPVLLEVLGQRLEAAANEAATTLIRTSFSPIVRESNDLSCVIFDAAGNAIADNTIGIPSFNVTIGRTLKNLLVWRPVDQWRPGDVAMTNDPWIASGHLPDVTMVMPIFSKNRLVAWTGTAAHQADMGGRGWTADTAEVYEEGLRIPPVLLLREHQLDETCVAFLSANVRLFDRVLGDLMAQVAAGRVAAERVSEIMQGMEGIDLGEVCGHLSELTDKSMREAVRSIPSGEYTAEMDLDGTQSGGPIHLAVKVIVSGSEILIDFGGSSGQVSAALNCVLNYTEAYSCYALKCLLDPATRRNEGSYRCITVTADEGSILNPRFPAAVNARHLVGHCLPGLIYRALAPAVPNGVIAESGSAPNLRLVFSGHNATGDPFSSILFVSGGMGAAARRDGLSATSFPSTVVCGAMETVEASAPIRVWRKELLRDSGGPGEFRGGLGQEVEVEVVDAQGCALSLFVERIDHPALGVLGGGPGGAASVFIKDSNRVLNPKGRNRLAAGDRVIARYPGGGGFGDVVHRKASSVIEDVESGYVSIEAARDAYGVRREATATGNEYADSH
jgi:N-methylhydantoinase B